MASFFEKLKKGMGIEESELSSLPSDDSREIEESELSSPSRTSVEGEEESLDKKETVKRTPRKRKITVSQKETVKKPKKLEIRSRASRGSEGAEEEEEQEEPVMTEEPVETEEEKEPSFAKNSELKETEVSSRPVADAPVKEEAKRTKFSSSSSIKEEWPAFSGEAEGQLAIDVYQTESDLVVQSAIAGVRPENLDIALEKDILTIKGMREKPFSEEGDYFSQECYWGPFSREIILPAEVDPNQATAKMKEGVLTIRIPKILREKKRKVIVTS